MSVVINSNSAATVASNNLAASSSLLQKSLNRLSSGSKIVSPSDDAGGLAVSMKLSAAARRQGAVESNIANAQSLLQTQDGVLNVTSKILSRIGELKVLNGDVTKSSSDRANYQSEFTALQAQLTAQGAEKFNGLALFGSAGLSVATTENGSSAVDIQGIPLLGTPAFPTFTDPFTDLSNWTSTAGSASASAGILRPNAGGSFGTVKTNQSFSGAFEINFEVNVPGSGDSVDISLGSDTLSSTYQGSELTQNAWTGVKIVFDGAGHASTYINGSGTAAVTQSGITATSGQISLQNIGLGSAQIRSFSVTSTQTTGSIATVANATTLSGLTLANVTDAIKDTATYRAQNGATQSRLDFASELVTVNKANLEAANSRIVDVDVAQESTALARYNVLVSAGTSMLAQANQSSQMALKLLS